MELSPRHRSPTKLVSKWHQSHHVCVPVISHYNSSPGLPLSIQLTPLFAPIDIWNPWACYSTNQTVFRESFPETHSYWKHLRREWRASLYRGISTDKPTTKAASICADAAVPDAMPCGHRVFNAKYPRAPQASPACTLLIKDPCMV